MPYKSNKWREANRDSEKEEKNIAKGSSKVMSVKEFAKMVNSTDGNILYKIAMGEQVKDGGKNKSAGNI